MLAYFRVTAENGISVTTLVHLTQFHMIISDIVRINIINRL